MKKSKVIRLPIHGQAGRPPSRGSDGARRIAHDSIPHLCQIELTYACNEKCVFCYNPGRERLGSLDKVDRVIASIAKSAIPHVYLIGGEPSLVPVAKLNEYIEQLSPTSSVTMVTNGLKRLVGVSRELACFGISFQGADAKTHESLNGIPGSFQKTLDTVRAYVSEGFDVRCITVLTGYNHDQMYDIIALAASLGMESVYVNRYEDGGIGAGHSITDRGLKPTAEQFREAISQIIRARRDFTVFDGRVGFGTAIPYCLDERIITEGLQSNCGVGSYFSVINPDGDFRMCNQSQLVFGNVLVDPIEEIWSRPELDMYRDLTWVSEPCSSCELLLDCTGGCKVDVNCSDKFCIDYAVRGLSRPLAELVSQVKQLRPAESFPVGLRRFQPDRYMKLAKSYAEKFIVTRYQTVKLDAMALEMAESILRHGVADETTLIERFSDRVEADEIRRFVSQLLQINAIELNEGARHGNS